MSQLGLRLEESDSSSSSDDEDHQLSIAEAYTVLDIRSGLLNPSRYCTAVQELKAVIQSLYKRRESTKEFKKNVEADVQTAIYEYHGGDFRSTDLRVLMLAVKNTLPQAKAQTLSREYKQKMLQVIRDTKKEERRRQQQQEEEKEAHQNARYSFANLPAECLETIFSHVEDPYTLARAAWTCKAWRHQAISNKFWQSFMQLTFGKVLACHRHDYDVLKQGFHFKEFSYLATSEKMAELLMPWRTDRIICHDAIRWCSPETRARVIANAGDKGIASNERSGVTFLDPQEVVLYLVTRSARAVVEVRKMAPIFDR